MAETVTQQETQKAQEWPDGQVVRARERFGAIVPTKLYRVAGRVMGNGGGVKAVRLARERGWWHHDLFIAVSTEDAEALVAKARELEDSYNRKARQANVRGITYDEALGMVLVKLAEAEKIAAE